MTTLADPLPGGRPGEVERATALATELTGRGVHGIVLAYVDPAGEFVPATTGPAYSATRQVELSDYGAELLSALAAQGVDVDQFHPEYAAGQFELSVGALDPVAAADRSVLVRQTVRAVSGRHG